MSSLHQEGETRTFGKLHLLCDLASLREGNCRIQVEAILALEVWNVELRPPTYWKLRETYGSQNVR